MSKISVIILTSNSEELIADCIDSLSFCDEIIVVDDSSTDRTVDIAKHLGAKAYSFSSPSFSEKRDFGLKKAKNKWILYIDDDERVTKELERSILEVSENENIEFQAFRIKRKNFYLGNNEWPYIEKLERFFLKKSFKEWSGELHETAIVSGEISELDGYLFHYTHRDLASMLDKTIKWSETEAILRFKANHPKMNSFRFLRVMLTGFYYSYIKQRGYKAGTMGLIESIFQSYSMFVTYARLWEMQNASDK